MRKIVGLQGQSVNKINSFDARISSSTSHAEVKGFLDPHLFPQRKIKQMDTFSNTLSVWRHQLEGLEDFCVFRITAYKNASHRLLRNMEHC